MYTLVVAGTISYTPIYIQKRLCILLNKALVAGTLSDMTRSSESGKQVFGRVSIVPEEFGRVISDRRKHLKLSLRDVADRAGVALGTVQNAERGDIKMGLDNLLRILAALNLLPENILRVDDQLVPTASPLEGRLTDLASNAESETFLRNLADLLKDARSTAPDKAKPKKRSN